MRRSQYKYNLSNWSSVEIIKQKACIHCFAVKRIRLFVASVFAHCRITSFQCKPFFSAYVVSLSHNQ